MSPDEPGDTRALAERYGIDFALVSDPDNDLARKLVGIDDQDLPLPSVIVVGPDRTVLRKVVSTSKDTRVYAADLLGLLDEVAGATGPPARGGFRPAEREQIVVGGSAGFGTGDADDGFRGGASARLLIHLGRRWAVGGGADWVTGDARRLEVGARVRLRRAGSGGLMSTYLEAPIGVAIRLRDASGVDRVGPAAGLRLGARFAWWPGLGFYVELGAGFVRWTGDATVTEFRADTGAGVSLLF